MSSESVIHIKIDQEGAINGKRSILFAQMGSLNVAKNIGRYRGLRLDELTLKSRMHSKLKDLKANIRKLQRILPVPARPKILKKESYKETLLEENSVKGVYKETDIESQLREIQGRLEKLQRENI